MLITRFNKMIRNKWLWGFFAVVVSIIFVFSFSPSGGGADQDQGNEGSLYGESVSAREFRMAQRFELEMRDDVRLNPRQRRLLRENAWRRIAVLKTAEKMGITATSDETDEMIRSDRRFYDQSGAFNRQMFQRYFKSMGQRESSERRIYRLFQEQNVILSKVITTLLSSLWISPFEIDERLHRILDSFVLEYAAFDYKEFSKPVKLSAEMAEEYYEENRILFEEPKRVKLAYAVFPVSNYYGQVHIESDAVSEYYRDHLDNYIMVSTNGTNSISVTQSLETVSEDIEGILQTMDASFEAKFQATQFALKLGDDDTGTNLVQAARKRSLRAGVTDFFAYGEDADGLSVNYDLYMAAFALDPTSKKRNISDAVLSENSAYVLSCVEIQEPFVPEFEIVKDDVMPLAMSNAVQEAFLARVDDIRDGIASMVESNMSFAAAVATYDVNAATTTSFVLSDGPSTNSPDYVSSLLPAVTLLTAGEVSEAVRADDRALIGRVVDRRAGDPMMARAYSGRVSWILTSHRIQILYYSLGDYLLDQADFKDNFPLPPMTEEERAESEANM